MTKPWLVPLALASGLGLAGPAHAQDPARPWADQPISTAAHLGVAVSQGNVDLATQLTDRLGVAPTGLLELSYRVTDHYSLGALAGGGIGTGSACGNEMRRSGCHPPVLGLASLFVRHHLVPSGAAEPWMGAGLGGSIFRASQDGAERGDYATADGRGTLDAVSSVHLGPEVMLGAGVAWRLRPTMSLGFAAHVFAGPYLYNREVREYSQGAEAQRTLPVPGVHGIFLLSVHLQFHTRQ